MAENFLTYTKVDPNSRFTVTAPKIAFTALACNETAYVYKDKGVGGIAGNYSYKVNILCTALTSTGMKIPCWAISNTLGEAQACYAGHTHTLFLFGATPTIYFGEDVSGTEYNQTYAITTHKEYFITISRNTAIGTYGTIYAAIYADEDRTDLLTTLTLTLHENLNYRYLYGIQSANYTNASTGTGFARGATTGETSHVF